MDVINVFSIYSQKEIFGKRESKDGLYQLFESIFEEFVVKRKNKCLYGICGGDFEVLQLRIKEKLLELLKKRKSNPTEISEWEGRFIREEVFHTKSVLGKDYELYSGGIDSQIWGLSILFDIILESEKESEILLFYSKRRSGFRKIKTKMNLIQLIKNKSI